MKVAIVGGKGKFGRMIVERMNEFKNTFDEPVIIDIDDPIKNVKGCDAIIDVTNASAFRINVKAYESFKIPLVIATTGLNDYDIENIKKMSKKFPVIMSGNFSITMYNFIQSVKDVVARFPSTTNVTIIEEHHKYKLDRPSGTAKMIKEAILKVNPQINEGKDIEILSVRGGSIHGKHTVILSNTDDEVITMEHDASSRLPFVSGITKASCWLVNFDSGFFTMDDFMMAITRKLNLYE